MTGEEIIEKLQGRLHGHLKGYLGYLGQEPYKNDFFRLFREAYDGKFFDATARPRLTGDALRDLLEVRWIEAMDDEEAERARAIMEDLLRRWDEWRYAWDKR